MKFDCLARLVYFHVRSEPNYNGALNNGALNNGALNNGALNNGALTIGTSGTVDW